MLLLVLSLLVRVRKDEVILWEEIALRGTVTWRIQYLWRLLWRYCDGMPKECMQYIVQRVVIREEVFCSKVLKCGCWELAGMVPFGV